MNTLIRQFFRRVEQAYGQTWFGGIATGEPCMKCGSLPARGYCHTNHVTEGAICMKCVETQ